MLLGEPQFCDWDHLVALGKQDFRPESPPTTSQSALHGFCSTFLWRFGLNSLEQVNDSNAKRLRHEVQACDGDIHPAVLKGPHLRAVKPGEVRKLVLRPAAHQAQLLDPSPEPFLNLFPLQ